MIWAGLFPFLFLVQHTICSSAAEIVPCTSSRLPLPVVPLVAQPNYDSKLWASTEIPKKKYTTNGCFPDVAKFGIGVGVGILGASIAALHFFAHLRAAAPMVQGAHFLITWKLVGRVAAPVCIFLGCMLMRNSPQSGEFTRKLFGETISRKRLIHAHQVMLAEGQRKKRDKLVQRRVVVAGYKALSCVALQQTILKKKRNSQRAWLKNISICLGDVASESGLSWRITCMRDTVQSVVRKLGDVVTPSDLHSAAQEIADVLASKYRNKGGL